MAVQYLDEPVVAQGKGVFYFDELPVSKPVAPIQPPEIPIGTTREERAALTTQRGMEARTAQAARMAYAGANQASIIAQIQRDLDAGIAVDPAVIAQYQDYLDMPEFGTMKIAPGAVRPPAPVEPPAPIQPAPIPAEPVAPLAPVPAEPALPQPEPLPTSIFAPEVLAPSISKPAVSFGGMLVRKAADVVKALDEIDKKIIGLPRQMRNMAFNYLDQAFPELMDKYRQSVSKSKEPELRAVYSEAEGKAIQTVNEFMDAVQETKDEAMTEIEREGGVPAKVAQQLAEGVASLAIDLVVLHKISGAQPGELTGTRELMKQAARQNAKVSAAVFASTPGTGEERLKAALHTTAIMGAPTVGSLSSRPWLAKTIAIATLAGLNTESYIEGFNEAQRQAIEAGNPEDWPKYAVGTIGVQAITDFAFGILTRARQGDKVARDLLDAPETKKIAEAAGVDISRPPEFRRPTDVEEITEEQPIRMEVPKKEVPSAAEERKIEKSRIIQREGADAQREAAEASRRDSLDAVRAEPTPAEPELGKKEAERVAPEIEAEIPAGEAKPPELMTPEAKKIADEFGAKPETDDRLHVVWGSRVSDGKPILIKEIERSAIVKKGDRTTEQTGSWLETQGYVREGDRYVFKGEPTEKPAAIAGKPAPEAPMTDFEVRYITKDGNRGKMWVQAENAQTAVSEAQKTFDTEGTGETATSAIKSKIPPEREVGIELTRKAEISEKDLVVKPLVELKDNLESQGVETTDMSRKLIVDEIKTRQNEKKANVLIDEIPIPEEAKRKRGLKNTAGAIGFEKPTRLSVPVLESDAAKAERMFEKQRADVRAKFKLTIGKMRDRASAALFGSDVPVTRRLWNNNGKKVVIAKVLSRGWGSKSERDFNNAENDIKDTIPHRLDGLFDDFIQAKRTIEVSNLIREQRGKQSELFAEGELPELIKSPAGLGAKENRAWLDEMKRQRPQDYKQMEVAHEKWKTVMRKQIDKLLDAGLIGKDTHEYLVKNHQNFSPRRFIQHIDPTIEVLIGGKKITVRDSGIESLDTGSEQSLLNNSSYLLAQTISGVEARIAKNKANKALYDYAKEHPENDLGLKLESITDAGKATPGGNTRISVLIDGKPATMVGPTETMKYWIDSDPQIKHGTLKILQYASGVKVVKALATGYNPEFALGNIPRDMAHYALVSQEYNPVLPIAFAQQIRDMITVLPDTIHRRGRLNDFIDDGGGMQYLSSQGQIGKTPGMYGAVHSEATRQISKFAGWLGETSEILTRLALRERALKNGKSREEATYIARQALDFAQGGTAVKTMDNFIPYLNAGTQGTRGILDALKSHPAETSFKIAQLIAFQTALSMWAKKTSEEEYDSISDAEKVSKFVVPTSLFARDKDGNKRFYYIGLPKDQGQQVFAILGNEMAEAATGGNPSWQRIRMAMENFSPADAQTLLPPITSAILGYIANKDFWKNTDIWKGRQVDPEFEQYATTPEAWKRAGKITGMSPERLRRSFSKVIPNNPFINIMGGIQGPLAASSDDSILERIGVVASKLPFIRRYLRITQPVDLTADDIKEADKLKIPTNYPDGTPRPRLRVKEELRDHATKQNNIRQLNDIHMDILMGQLRRKEINKQELNVWLERVKESGEPEDRLEYMRLRERRAHKYRWSL